MSSQPRSDLMKWDQEADEPYMLIPRFPDLRLTPWREGEDVDAAVKLFNEPSVAKYSFRRPFPFLPEHLDWMRTNIFPPATKCIQTVLRPLLRPSPTSPTLTHPLPPHTGAIPFFPLIIIRHQPSGKMIGDFQLVQPPSAHSESAEDQAKAFGGQVPQFVPPEEQTWELVYNLSPEWTGRGIGGAVLDVVLEGWVRWLGIGTIMAGAETANLGSSGLVKSRGFVKVKTFMETYPEEKGGGQREVSHWALRMADYEPRPLEG